MGLVILLASTLNVNYFFNFCTNDTELLDFQLFIWEQFRLVGKYSRKSNVLLPCQPIFRKILDLNVQKCDLPTENLLLLYLLRVFLFILITFWSILVVSEIFGEIKISKKADPRWPPLSNRDTIPAMTSSLPAADLKGNIFRRAIYPPILLKTRFRQG